MKQFHIPILTISLVITSCFCPTKKAEPIILGYEGKDVHLKYLHEGSSVPDTVNRHLELISPTGIQILNHFSQMKGKVHILNSKQALTFVRLQTSLVTFFYWDYRSNLGFEIVTAEQATHLPTYGLERYYQPYGLVKPKYHDAYGGEAGVLYDNAYKEGGFTPPIVTARSGHFEIVRWIYSVRGVEKIREYVNPDGAYHYITLRRMAPPKLHDTYWRLPVFA